MASCHLVVDSVDKIFFICFAVKKTTEYIHCTNIGKVSRDQLKRDRRGWLEIWAFMWFSVLFGGIFVFWDELWRDTVWQAYGKTQGSWINRWDCLSLASRGLEVTHTHLVPAEVCTHTQIHAHTHIHPSQWLDALKNDTWAESDNGMQNMNTQTKADSYLPTQRVYLTRFSLGQLHIPTNKQRLTNLQHKEDATYMYYCWHCSQDHNRVIISLKVGPGCICSSTVVVFLLCYCTLYMDALCSSTIRNIMVPCFDSAVLGTIMADYNFVF